MAVETHGATPSQSYDITRDESGADLEATGPRQRAGTSLLRPRRHPIEVLTLRELAMRPQPTWRIGNLIGSNSLCLLHGATGIGKTWVAASMALSVASDVPWFGAAVQGAQVVYVCAEGVVSMADRFRGLARDRAHFEQVQDRILLVPRAISLIDAETIEELLATLERLNAKPGLVVIDTVGRSLGGGNENDTRDMSAAIAGCEELQRHLAATLLLVHHSARNTERSRGSSALEAAVDTEMQLTLQGKSLELRCRKQRNAAAFEPLLLARRVVELEADPVHGKATSCRLELLVGSRRPAGRQVELRCDAVLQALREAGGSGLTSRTLSARTGGKSGTYDDALKSLREARRIIRTGTGAKTRYTLGPGQHSAPALDNVSAGASAELALVSTSTTLPLRGAGGRAEGRSGATGASARARRQASMSSEEPTPAAATRDSTSRGRSANKK